MRMVYDKLFQIMKEQDKDISFLINTVKLKPITVIKIQLGENIDRKSIEKICKAFDCAFDEIYEIKDDPEINLINSKRSHKNDKTPIYQCNKAGDVINKFESIREAARSLKKQSSAIVQCVNGNRKTAYGYTWKKVTELQ